MALIAVRSRLRARTEKIAPIEAMIPKPATISGKTTPLAGSMPIEWNAE